MLTVVRVSVSRRSSQDRRVFTAPASPWPIVSTSEASLRPSIWTTGSDRSPHGRRAGKPQYRQTRPSARQAKAQGNGPSAGGGSCAEANESGTRWGLRNPSSLFQILPWRCCSILITSSDFFCNCPGYPDFKSTRSVTEPDRLAAAEPKNDWRPLARTQHAVRLSPLVLTAVQSWSHVLRSVDANHGRSLGLLRIIIVKGPGRKP